jgi:3-hydroxyacyl-[acyl-carrier-protein] dehydratase
LFVDPGADYLRDHFPDAPMLPGLMMLEAAVRAAGELLRANQPCIVEHSMLERLERLHVLRRVAPGETFVVRTDMIGDVDADRTATFSAVGSVAGNMAMRARFQLRALTVERTDASKPRSEEVMS